LLRFVFSSQKATIGGPAIFIDRDGVINRRRPGDYVLNWSQFIFMPDIRSALKQLSSLRLPMIIISNQAAVGKNLLDPSDLEKITAQLHQTLLTDGVSLFAAYYCPHRSTKNCICRKPKPALLYQAASDFKIDLARSIFIGDSDTDVQAARSAGCQPILFGTGLRSCSKSQDWLTALPVAHTSSELFQVAVDSLQIAKHAATRGRVASEESR